MKQENLNSFIDRINQLKRAGEIQLVCDEAEKLLVADPTDFGVRIAVSGCFIDSGSDLQKIEIIDKGISIIEELLSGDNDLTTSQSVTLKYNLSNGYSARSHILSQQGKLFDADNAIQNAKILLQSLLLNKRDIGSELLPNIVCNYADVLGKLDRNVEAIDQYLALLQTFPEHANSMGNCGIAIKSIRFVSGQHAVRNIYEAWRFLSLACKSGDKVLKHASPLALDWYQQHLNELEMEIEAYFDDGLDDLLGPYASSE